MTLSHYFGDGICWIRFLGRGVAIKDKIKHPPLFSERYGYKKVLRVGKWGVELLGRRI